MNLKILLFMFIFSVVFCIDGYGDTVEMKNGGKVEGIIIEETDDHVKVELESSGTVTIKKSDVENIIKLSPEEVENLRQKWLEKKETEKWIQEVQGKVAVKIQQEETAFIKWCKEHSISTEHEGAKYLKKISEQRKQEGLETYCRVCDAIGKIACEKCGAYGKVSLICKKCDRGSIICLICSGIGSFICDSCNGEGGGYRKCPSCSGKGWLKCKPKVRCEVCGGTGNVTEYSEEIYYDNRGNRIGKGYGETKKTCPNCNGTGEVVCKICNGTGQVLCSVCDGEGKSYLQCFKCSGLGTVVCKGCNGLRTKRCESCGGNYKIIQPCPLCDGKGFFPCQTCKGTGVMVQVNGIEKLKENIAEEEKKSPGVLDFEDLIPTQKTPGLPEQDNKTEEDKKVRGNE